MDCCLPNLEHRLGSSMKYSPLKKSHFPRENQCTQFSFLQSNDQQSDRGNDREISCQSIKHCSVLPKSHLYSSQETFPIRTLDKTLISLCIHWALKEDYSKFFLKEISNHAAASPFDSCQYPSQRFAFPMIK